MINCEKCIKNDVCKYNANLADKLKSLEVAKEVQALAQFKVNVSCEHYYQVTKVLRGEN